MSLEQDLNTQVQFVQDRPAWDQIGRVLPNGHVLQSWDWGVFKERWGWQAQRLQWRLEDQPVAAAQVLRRPIPGSPWSFLYVSKGPVLDYNNEPLAEQVLADLEQLAQTSQALFIKIDPDVVRCYDQLQSEAILEPAGRLWLDLLARRGWHFSPEQIQFRNTMVIDLNPEPATLLANMKSKWRYNIRLAERRGVTIRPGTVQDTGIFYQMYAETAARDNFFIRPEAYYQDVWQLFINTGQAEMLLAEVEGEIVAGLILFVYGQTAWYLYGASTGQHRRLMPNHLLQWRAIWRARELGCLRYDMWGAPTIFDQTDSMWGVYRFKQGFGGRLLQGLGAYDYPVNRIPYWAFTKALPRLRTLVRRLK